MRVWSRRVAIAAGFLLLLASALPYFLAGLVVDSGMVPVVWVVWSLVFLLALGWRRRPILVLVTPLIAVALLVVMIVVAGLIFGNG